MEKLHPGAKWLFRFRVYGVFILIAIWGFFMALGFIANHGNLSIVSSIIVTIILCVLVIILIGEIYARLSYIFWAYEFTKTALKIEKGIIWKTYKSIPYERVQNIDLKRGVLARILGFSTLEIQTAGYSAIQANGRAGVHSEGYIPAVATDEAERIREFMIKKIGKRQGL